MPDDGKNSLGNENNKEISFGKDDRRRRKGDKVKSEKHPGAIADPSKMLEGAGIPHQASISREVVNELGSRARDRGKAREPLLAHEIQVGMILYVARKVRVESELGQKLINRLNIDPEEVRRFEGRSILWRVAEVEGYVWDVAGFDNCPAYRITFVTTSPAGVMRVEEYFPNNPVGFPLM